MAFHKLTLYVSRPYYLDTIRDSKKNYIENSISRAFGGFTLTHSTGVWLDDGITHTDSVDVYSILTELSLEVIKDYAESILHAFMKAYDQKCLPYDITPVVARFVERKTD